MQPTTTHPTETTLCATCGATLPAISDLCPQCAGPVRLAERYRLEAQLGHGATGLTYRAIDEHDDRRVAIKELSFRHTPRPQLSQRFEREAQVLKQLAHPRIPAYIAHFRAGQGKQHALYIVQAFIPGVTLREEMQHRRYTEPEVLDIADEVLDILDYLHRLAPPVIHRDIKPANILRSESDGRLWLLDFGSVRDLLQDPQLGGSTVAGTFGYMAPEQFRGDAYPTSDLYAVGALIIELLSRRDPQDLMGLGSTLAWEHCTPASEKLKAILRRLLDPNPAARPRSARAVRDALRSPHRSTARSQSRLGPLWRAVRSMRASPPASNEGRKLTESMRTLQALVDDGALTPAMLDRERALLTASSTRARHFEIPRASTRRSLAHAF